ncbi:hypothetical protein F511_26613 [Dorcoceras hygrometricum]|uniref:Uncharacterized protein n=1 Tax=Dorcoceras hygrometricum TaxID=472368 RepID=A0A2Z7D9M0_9LAMI|nr:hypothetical protein F511_26613 [Dorcoceras hygrometricum]
MECHNRSTKRENETARVRMEWPPPHLPLKFSAPINHLGVLSGVPPSPLKPRDVVVGVHRIVTLLASRRLAPTSFTRKPALQTVGGGRSSIRSMIGIKTPSSACTRRTDEFSTDGKSSARWPEQVRRRGGGAWVADGRRVGWPRGEVGGRVCVEASIGYPRMKASGESSTTKHRLLHASEPHPIPPPNDPKRDVMFAADCNCVVLLAADQQMRNASVEKRRRLS